MGQTQSPGGSQYFQDARLRAPFVAVQTWTEEELRALLDRLKDLTLNFSLDRVKFSRLLQLPSAEEPVLAQWFEIFSGDRASQVVDGLEFLSALIMINSQVMLVSKIGMLFSLFDLDRTGCIRKDEFTIFLKSLSTGLYRTLDGLPPPPPVAELSGISSDFFSSMEKQALSETDLLMWLTEAHASLSFLSVLSRLGTGLCVFAWGSNRRGQLGLHLAPGTQVVPSPVLGLEGVRVASVAAGESHCLFLTAEGIVWSCGAGFCGLLGHGDLQDVAEPRTIAALAHTRIVDVAAGVRHSVAISEKGQVFTWGNAALGQLGHGSIDDQQVHTHAFDPRTGGRIAYVPCPTVVMGLFGRRVHARHASCCNFSTAVLTDRGHIYTWGNNTDGQCGHGLQCSEMEQLFVDPHMKQTALQILPAPKRLEVGSTVFRSLACGGYHMMAIDAEDRLWTWGQGELGKLGHGNQLNAYSPKLVESLRYQLCQTLAAGVSHSLCLISLYRITVTGSEGDSLSPFSLMAMPLGRPDRQVASRQPMSPPNTSLTLDAFASGPLLQVKLPLDGEWDGSMYRYPVQDVQESLLLLDRPLYRGTWLKLGSTNFDFAVCLAQACPQLQGVIEGPVVFSSSGEVSGCEGKIVIFGPGAGAQSDAQAPSPSRALELARRCLQWKALACVCVLPAGCPAFVLEAPGHDAAAILQAMPFGVMSHEHGVELRKSLLPHAKASLLDAPEAETSWARHLLAVLELKPKGVVICQRSCRPDMEFLAIEDFILTELQVPLAMVSFEGGNELKATLAAADSKPWLTCEVQESGGLCAWGDSSLGQLGLGHLAEDHLSRATSSVSGKECAFAETPCFLAQLHEHQVTDIACGAEHSVAVTQQGEVFSWGAADSLGVPMGTRSCRDFPVLVEQLSGTALALRAFAGHHQTYVLAELPFPSVL